VKYTSNIKNMPFLFLEMKRTAMLLLEGKTPEDIRTLSVEQNVYQLDKEQRRRELSAKMLARLTTLNDVLVRVIATGQDDEAKLVAFFAMMKSDRLLFEYMYEVVADKYSMGHREVTDRDFEDFIDRKIQNCDTVAGWKKDNLVKVRNAIKSTLVGAGLAKKNGNELELLSPIVDKDFGRLFGDEDKPYIKAMMLEV